MLLKKDMATVAAIRSVMGEGLMRMAMNSAERERIRMGLSAASEALKTFEDLPDVEDDEEADEDYNDQAEDQEEEEEDNEDEDETELAEDEAEESNE